MNSDVSRRTFLRTGCRGRSGLRRARSFPGATEGRFRRAIARQARASRRYTFRNFTRAQMIPWLKQLQVTSINART